MFLEGFKNDILQFLLFFLALIRREPDDNLFKDLMSSGGLSDKGHDRVQPPPNGITTVETCRVAAVKEIGNEPMSQAGSIPYGKHNKNSIRDNKLKVI